MTKKTTKIVQIQYSETKRGETLFGLDDEGNVWVKETNLKGIGGYAGWTMYIPHIRERTDD